MTNHKNAAKMVRKIARRTKINRARKSKVLTYIRKVENAIKSNDKQVALDTFKIAQPIMHKGVTKGVFHLNTISRKLSRLSARIKKMQA